MLELSATGDCGASCRFNTNRARTRRRGNTAWGKRDPPYWDVPRVAGKGARILTRPARHVRRNHLVPPAVTRHTKHGGWPSLCFSTKYVLRCPMVFLCTRSSTHCTYPVCVRVIEPDDMITAELSCSFFLFPHCGMCSAVGAIVGVDDAPTSTNGCSDPPCSASTF